MGILESIVAIAGAVSAFYGIYKLAVWQLSKTTEEKVEDIAAKIKKDKEDFEKGGRPKW